MKKEGEVMSKEQEILLTAKVDCSHLDIATEKVSRLKALLEEVKELISSLSATV